MGDGGEPRLNVLFRVSTLPKEGALRSQAQDCASSQNNRPLTRSQRFVRDFRLDRQKESVHKNVHDSRDKERQDAGDRQEKRRTDEEGGDAAALRGRRGDPEGHDEGIGDGFEEFQGAALL